MLDIVLTDAHSVRCMDRQPENIKHRYTIDGGGIIRQIHKTINLTIQCLTLQYLNIVDWLTGRTSDL